MDTSEPYLAPASQLAIEKAADEPGAGIGSTAQSRSITGFRLVSFVAVPLAAVSLILGLAITAFGAGTGRGWGWPKLVIAALGMCTVIPLVYGAIPGAVVGLIAGILRRGRPVSQRSSFWTRLNRPIRFPFGRGSTRGPQAAMKPGFFRRYWPWLVGTPIVVVMTLAYGAGVYLASGRPQARRGNRRGRP